MDDNEVLRVFEDFFKRTKEVSHEEKSIFLMMMNYVFRHISIPNPIDANENHRLFELHTDSEKETFTKILVENFDEDKDGYFLKESSCLWGLGTR